MALGDRLIIGVFTDSVAESFKRKPIMNQDERLRNLQELGWGDVILQNSFEPEILKSLSVDIVAKAEGAGWSKDHIPQYENVQSVLLEYTGGISTSDIIKRVWDRR
jgi:glycerol-3-phosphate cytidylyltransferase-like family protein